MSVQANFTASIPSSSIGDAFYGKIIRTYVKGKLTPGDLEDEPRILLAKWLYRNWTCDIPLSQIGYDQYFTGYGDLVIKFKEDNAIIIGGITGHNDYIEAGQFLQEFPYRSRVQVFIEARVQTPDPIPDIITTIKTYIKEFIRERPLGLLDEGITEMYLTSGAYNYPEQRDKSTFKDQIDLIMKYTKLYR